MNPDTSDRSLRSRRQVLGAIAGASVSVALAGCSGGGGSETEASPGATTTSQETAAATSGPITEQDLATTTARGETSSQTSATVTEQDTTTRTVREETAREAETTDPATETATGKAPTTQVTAGTATTGGTVGACPSPPGPDADPKAVIPEPPSGWSLVDEYGEAAGMVDAEVGYSGVYADPNGDEYTVEILRWPSPDKAQEGVKMYREGDDERSKLYLVLGRFTFSGSGPETERVRTLLAASPVLTENCVGERGNGEG